MKENLLKYTLHLADNALILGHRLSEWCGHGPVLEQDIALTNIALDLVGQARNLYQYAAEISGDGKTEDDFPYLRKENEFRNVLLTEYPNEDFAYTIVRQFLYDSYNFYFYNELKNSSDKRLAAIAEKSLKEITYHLRFSSEWMIRLGDGTEVSHEKMQNALEDLYPFWGELVQAEDYETALLAFGVSVDLNKIKPGIEAKVKEIMEKATLKLPEISWFQSGGKKGHHTEQLGFILTDLQYLQRTYPGAEW